MVTGARGTVSRSALAVIDKSATQIRTDSSERGVISPGSHTKSNHDSRSHADQLKTGGTVSALGGDQVLRAICDWAIFEGKLLNLPELRLPFTYISNELSTDGWNNIPIPIVEALEIVKETFHNTENIFIATLRETKLRTEGIAKKFKADLQQAKEREEILKK